MLVELVLWDAGIRTIKVNDEKPKSEWKSVYFYNETVSIVT